MIEDEPFPLAISDSLPLRLGFWLERVGVTCLKWPSVPYRGIDRPPYLPSLEEEDELRSTGRRRLADLWDHYWDAEDSGELNINLRLAQDVQREFFNEGIEFEVVYGEIVTIPQNLYQYPHGTLWTEFLLEQLPRIRRIHQNFAARPQGIRWLGYDISHPIDSFHSAIFQPGLHETCPGLPDDLNRAGLFDDLNAASRYLHAANEMDYGPLPFCVLGIWEVLSS